MTFATYITIFRILLIPVFIAGLLYYDLPSHQELFRWIAVGAFLAASVSDALDGWIARKYKQRSEIGALLDPIADKALMLSAIVTLSFIKVPGLNHLPLWFLVLVLGRDAIQLVGFLVLHVLNHKIQVIPHWTGKVATCLQLATVSAILLKLSFLPIRQMVWLAGLFTFISLVVYMSRGIQLANSGPATVSGGPRH